MKYLAIAAAITAADQITKRCAEQSLMGGNEITIGKLRLRNLRNSGAAMGLFANKPHLLTAMTAAATVQVLSHFYRINKAGKLDNTYKFSCACIFGGAAGNIIDRSRLGYVTDFIQVGRSPVFNIADVFVALGTIIFTIKQIQGFILNPDFMNPLF